MKTRIKGGNKQSNKEKTVLSTKFKSRLYLGLAIISMSIFMVVFAPFLSMQLQNNQVDNLNSKAQTVLFYKSGCSACQKIYPTVFWHNVKYYNQPDKQIQVVNVQNMNNQHYIADYSVTQTPTFMNKTQPNARVTTTNKQVVNGILNHGVQ